VAIKALRQLQNDEDIKLNIFMFNYSMFSFDYEFDVKEFIEKIRKFTNAEIIISFLRADVTFNNKQMEILNKLRNEGIKFCVDYIEE
jgi:hypothetical protein